MDNNFRSLRLKNIRKEFPGVLALDDVSLEAKAGSVHALMGENGAGKSTLIKILAGAYSKDQGTILFDNKEVNIDNPNDSLNLGIKVVYQEIALIPEFTVAENIFLEKFPVNSLGIVNWKKLYNDCNNLLKKIGFNLNIKAKVVDLSISEQQIVEIARAIFQNALVVVMDEPTSSLTPNEIEKLFEVIENLKKNNIAIIYITHKIDEIFKIANEVTVLRDGKLISNRDINDTSEEILIQDMVGRKVEQKFERPNKSFDKVLMNIKNISTKSKLKDISFDPDSGERAVDIVSGATRYGAESLNYFNYMARRVAIEINKYNNQYSTITSSLQKHVDTQRSSETHQSNDSSTVSASHCEGNITTDYEPVTLPKKAHRLRQILRST